MWTEEGGRIGLDPERENPYIHFNWLNIVLICDVDKII